MIRRPRLRLFGVAAIVSAIASGAVLQAPSRSAVPGDIGVWVNVTPANVDLTSRLDCDNYGTTTIAADPARQSDIYTYFDCQGIWKSTDYGVTWSGPINTGIGGANVRGAGGLAIARGAEGQPPILYTAGIRGTGTGFWKSTDGGVNWARYHVAPGGNRQDFYKPEVNPYNSAHLLMAGHEMELVVESFDGGRTWAAMPLANGMKGFAGTAGIYFINTGSADTTAVTWLWVAQMTGGKAGTWRTAAAGKSWTFVNNNERPHGGMQIYQPDTSGVIYIAGVYSRSGWGVLRSTDFGQTWNHVGKRSAQATVFGTPSKVFSAYSWACGVCTVAPDLQSAPSPGAHSWATVPTPPEMKMGPAQTATVFDGNRYVIISANWHAGLWRYVD